MNILFSSHSKYKLIKSEDIAKIYFGVVYIVLTLLDNLKMDIVKELMVIKDNKIINNISKSDEQMKLDRVKGILKNRIADPMEKRKL